MTTEQHLRQENERLLSYIRACRLRFGDAAVNSAIMELCPPTGAPANHATPIPNTLT